MFTIKNSEGYNDPTMYFAIRMADSTKGFRQASKTLPLRRGDIYLVHRGRYNDGPGCPVIVVSGDVVNKACGQVQVVYLTLSPKNNLPTNVEVNNNGKRSFAKCGEISCVPASALYTQVGHVADEEMERIENGIRLALGLAPTRSTKQMYKEQLENKIHELQCELALIDRL